MRRPILMAAAAAVAAVPIVLMSRHESLRTTEPMKEELRTFDAEEASPPARDMPALAAAMPPPTAAAPAPPPSPDYAPDIPPQGGAASPAILPEAAPRIAYSYGYRFRVPTEALAPLQERHLQLCQSLGPVRCRVVSMRRSESRRQAPRDEGYGGGAPAPDQPAAALELQVAAEIADELGRRLTSTTGEARGETVDRQISGDDVSKAMVDSEARIRTREALIRRLSALLETRSGNIEQAVEAERAINQAQEELDAARTWLAETRGRVAMSRIAIAYEPLGAGAAAPADRNPIGTALQRVGSLTVQSLAALLLVAGVVIPWALVGLLIAFVARRHRRRTDATVAE